MRCMSGVTMKYRRNVSSLLGSLILLWLNIEVAFKTISDINTAIAKGPRSSIRQNLIVAEMNIDTG